MFSFMRKREGSNSQNKGIKFHQIVNSLPPSPVHRRRFELRFENSTIAFWDLVDFSLNTRRDPKIVLRFRVAHWNGTCPAD
jgi:hypothetical protein